MGSKETAEISANTERPPQDVITTNNAPDLVGSDAKEVKVQSIELTDALAKDKPNYRSKSQIMLFSFMIFATLSTQTRPSCEPVDRN